MKKINSILLFVCLLIISSCYHAQILTDAKPSSEVIDKKWASSFIFGLVPPKEVSTASQCPNGVAKVETEISFLNGVVSAITLNIYTPMHIRVTCAAGSGMSAIQPKAEEQIKVPKNSTEARVIEAIQEASVKAVETDRPFYVQFD